MAFTTAAGLSKLTIEQNNIVSQINRRTPFLGAVPMVVSAPATNLAWSVNTGGSTARMHAEGATAGAGDQDVRAHAVLGWAEADSTFGVTDLNAATAAAGNPLAGEDTWATELANHARELAYLLEGQILGGDGTGVNMTGLAYVLTSLTNTYASINRTTAGNAYWRPYVADPGIATALTKAQIETDLLEIKLKCGEAPDGMIVHPYMTRRIKDLFSDTITRGPGPVPTAAFGFAYEGFTFNGVSIIESPQAVDGRILYVNSNHYRLKVLPTYAPGVLATLQQVWSQYGDGSVRELPTPMGFNFKKLPDDGHIEKGMLLFKGQLQVDRVNSMGSRLNIATA